MRPSLKARAHKSLRFSPSEDDAAVVIKFLIALKSASSMNSQNATRVCVGDDVSSRVAISESAVAVGAANFDLLCFFLLLGPMVCTDGRIGLI